MAETDRTGLTRAPVACTVRSYRSPQIYTKDGNPSLPDQTTKVFRPIPKMVPPAVTSTCRLSCFVSGPFGANQSIQDVTVDVIQVKRREIMPIVPPSFDVGIFLRDFEKVELHYSFISGKDGSVMQRIAYEPIKKWLETKGFKALIAGDRTTFVISVSDLVPVAYKIPDLVGVRGHQVVIVEVETNKKQFFDALGRCMLWRCTATFVYLAYPKGVISRAPFLNRLGIGLLEIDVESETVSELVSLPQEGHELHWLVELHPTDHVRENALAEQIEKNLG